MAIIIRSLKDIRVDLYQAVKRAILHRGLLPISESPRDKPTKHLVSNSTSSSTNTEPIEEMSTEAPAEVKEDPPTAKKEEHERITGPEKLIELDEQTHDVLLEADSVFPFTLFPDTVTLDREKLT